MVAAWSDASVPENMRGTTVSLTVAYLASAEHKDIQATARVLQRGRSLVYLDVEVGKNGKPFFVAGPYDNATHIIKQLEKTAGPGNYDYLIPIGDF